MSLIACLIITDSIAKANVIQVLLDKSQPLVRSARNIDFTKQQIVQYGFEEVQRMILDNSETNPDPGGLFQYQYSTNWNAFSIIEFRGGESHIDSYRQLIQKNRDGLTV
jgi:hypothetical protein